MSNLVRHRAGRNRAPVESLPLWLAADERERHRLRALTIGGRWLQCRVPGLAGALADTFAIANGLGGAR